MSKANVAVFPRNSPSFVGSLLLGALLALGACGSDEAGTVAHDASAAADGRSVSDPSVNPRPDGDGGATETGPGEDGAPVVDGSLASDAPGGTKPRSDAAVSDTAQLTDAGPLRCRNGSACMTADTCSEEQNCATSGVRSYEACDCKNGRFACVLTACPRTDAGSVAVPVCSADAGGTCETKGAECRTSDRRGAPRCTCTSKSGMMPLEWSCP